MTLEYSETREAAWKYFKEKIKERRDQRIASYSWFRRFSERLFTLDLDEREMYKLLFERGWEAGYNDGLKQALRIMKHEE